MGEENDGTKQKRSWRVTATASRTWKIATGLVTTGVSIAGAIVGGFFGPILAYLLGLCHDPFICIDWRWILLGACLGFLLPFILAVLLALGRRGFSRSPVLRVAGTVLVVLALLALTLWWGITGRPLNAQHLSLQYQLGKRHFRGADLRGGNLQGANLQGAHLEEADLREADLRNANLYGAFLDDADLRGANLIGADLRQASLETDYLDSTSQIDPKWRLVRSISQEGGAGRELSGSDLEEANLFDTSLREANLTGARLSGANLSRADLTGADLTGADLTGARLSVANLSRADLTGADLTGASLHWASLTGATVTDEQLAQAYTLEGATLPDGSVHE